MGTLLQDKGLDDGGSGELWNVERPDAIRDAHRAYAEAGARILTTNTFGGTRPRLDMHGLGDRVHELNEAGARLAREVADEHGALVAGDLGPTGELMAPLGTMDAAEAQAIFAEQLAGLRDGGIDLVLIETMSDLAEVEAAVAAAREVVPDLPIVATLSFDTNLRTMMGVRPADAVTALAAAGVDAVGANCGRGPDEMAQPSPPRWPRRAPRACCSSPSPTPACPQVVGDHFEYDATPDDMAQPRRRAARPRHRPDRRLLRLDPRARRRDQPRPRMSRWLTAPSSARTGSPAARGPARPGTMRDYHDTEWGVPVRGERGLFERLCLEGFQAGLSWSTILNKRDRFREVFHDFDVDRVAAMTDADVERLMQRHRHRPQPRQDRGDPQERRGHDRAARRRRARGVRRRLPPRARPRAARTPPRCRRPHPSRSRCPRPCASAASASSGRPRCTR